jgi:hypothetical protein
MRKAIHRRRKRKILTDKNAYTDKMILRDASTMPSIRQAGTETWYLTYALLGAAVGGISPIIIPLLALKRFGGAVQVGFVLAAYNLGGLSAPFWGGIADRYGSNGHFLFLALSLVTAVLVLLSHTTNYLSWLGISLVEGIGVVGAVTLGTLFIVKNHPRDEWGNRIGRLQMVNGGGQVCGLLLAALLSRYSLKGALLVAAGLTALAVIPGRLTPRTTVARRPQSLLCFANNRNREPQTNYRPESNLLHLRAIIDLIHDLSLPFKRFMVVWFLCLMVSARHVLRSIRLSCRKLLESAKGPYRWYLPWRWGYLFFYIRKPHAVTVDLAHPCIEGLFRYTIGSFHGVFCVAACGDKKL